VNFLITKRNYGLSPTLREMKRVETKKYLCFERYRKEVDTANPPYW